MPSKKRSKTEEYVRELGRPWKVVCVEWMDAASRDRWISPEEPHVAPAKIISVGLLRSRTASATVICLSAGAEEGDVHLQLAIPAGMVQRVTELYEIEEVEDAQ